MFIVDFLFGRAVDYPSIHCSIFDILFFVRLRLFLLDVGYCAFFLDDLVFVGIFLRCIVFSILHRLVCLFGMPFCIPGGVVWGWFVYLWF